MPGPLKISPLDAVHRQLGARLVGYAGWETPLQFSSILEEHRAVRSAAGLFDVSHMGEIEVRGPEALPLVQRLTCNDAARLEPGRTQYSALTTVDGTFVDDIMVYRRGADDFLLVVNAGNTDRAFAWIARHAEGDVEVVNASERWAMLALQGPRAISILRTHAATDPGTLRSFSFLQTRVGSVETLISRTGYTGEDGFEIYLDPDGAPEIFLALLEGGRPEGLVPCGLGARDTLRLEAAMRLYGNDIDETTTVLEAGLEGIVKWEKGEFVGRAALTRQKEEGVERHLVGFELSDRGVPRHGQAVRVGGAQVGIVTSGTLAPHLGRPIGLAYVPERLSTPGSRLNIDIRGREAAAVVVRIPFYKRARDDERRRRP
jgi:aminomethyltransferase